MDDVRALVEIDSARFPFVREMTVDGVTFVLHEAQALQLDRLTLDMQTSVHLLIDGETYEARLGLPEVGKYQGGTPNAGMPALHAQGTDTMK